MKRWEGTTWKASPAWMYSTIRETLASNCSRVMFDSNSTCSERGGTSATGTGSRRRSRTAAIVSAARS